MKNLCTFILAITVLSLTSCGEKSVAIKESDSRSRQKPLTAKEVEKPVEQSGPVIPKVIETADEQPYDKGVKKNAIVKMTTSLGVIEFKLYDETPRHRDNFLKLAEDGFYNELLFHRVISNFMIQGGDPKSKGAAPGASLGIGGPGYTIPAEINSNFIHKKGALSAARRGGAGNPDKRSSGSQFYLVQGSKQNDTTLDQLEKRTGVKYTPEQREIYKTIGGYPSLDTDYTVYGEVTKGLDVIDKIAAVETLKDRPIEDVVMNVEILKQ